MKRDELVLRRDTLVKASQVAGAVVDDESQPAVLTPTPDLLRLNRNGPAFTALRI